MNINGCAVAVDYDTEKQLWQVIHHTTLNGSPLGVAGWGETFEIAAEEFAKNLIRTLGELKEPA